MGLMAQILEKIDSNLVANLDRADRAYLVQLVQRTDHMHDWKSLVCRDVYGMSKLDLYHVYANHGEAVLILRNAGWGSISKHETVIISNSYRATVDMHDFAYVYIPLTEQEQRMFSPTCENPCWRITVDKRKGAG